MRLTYDDEERAILVQRFCDSPDVTNDELASCIAAELADEDALAASYQYRPPRPGRRRRPKETRRPNQKITARDWENMHELFGDDFDDEGGYANDPNLYGRG